MTVRRMSALEANTKANSCQEMYKCLSPNANDILLSGIQHSTDETQTYQSSEVSGSRGVDADSLRPISSSARPFQNYICSYISHKSKMMNLNRYKQSSDGGTEVRDLHRKSCSASLWPWMPTPTKNRKANLHAERYRQYVRAVTLRDLRFVVVGDAQK